MARFGRKAPKRFKVRTQAFFGKRGARIGLVAPGIRRARRRPDTGVRASDGQGLGGANLG